MEEAAWREQLTEIVDNIAAGIVVLNPEGQIIFANPEAARIFGRSRSAMVGKFYDTVTEKITTFTGQPFPTEQRAFCQAKETGEPVYGVEYLLERPDGSKAAVSVNAAPIFDDDHQIIALVGSLMDITKRKTTEDALREAEQQRFQTVADSSVDAIMSINAAGKITFWNHAAEKQFGYACQEVNGRDITVIIPAHLRDRHKHALKHFIATSQPHIIGRIVELEGVRKDGHIFPIELSLATWMSGADRYFTATIRDITERKKGEAEVELLAAIVRSSADAIISESLDGTIQSWNPGANKIYGYTSSEITGRSIAALVPPDNPEELPRLLKALRKGERISHYRAVHRRKDGTLISVCYVVSPIRDKNEALIGASMIAHHLKENPHLPKKQAA